MFSARAVNTAKLVLAQRTLYGHVLWLGVSLIYQYWLEYGIRAVDIMVRGTSLTMNRLIVFILSG